MAQRSVRVFPRHGDLQGLAAMYDISLAVNRSLNLEQVLETALDKTLGLLEAQAGCIYLVDRESGKLALRVERSLTPAFVAEKSVVAPGEGCAGQAVVTGEIYASYDHPEKVFVCADSERLMGLDCLVASPLTAKGRVVGVLELFAPASRRLTPEEGKLLSTIGGIVGVAVDNARLYQESQATVQQLTRVHEELNHINRTLETHLRQETHVARTLQQVLLPTELPSIPGLSLGGYYLGSSSDLDVGGDFYDVARLSERRVALIIGDICGKGLDAAVQTAAVKYALRTYLTELGETSQALERANRMLVAQEAIDSFATVLVAIADADSGDVEYASAGHPPPIRLSGRTTDRLPGGGLPLGIDSSAEFPAHCVRLEKGDLLAFYTDGLLEARSGKDMFGMGGVSRTLSQLVHLPAPSAARALAERCRQFAGGEIRDDLAILLVRRLDGHA